MKPKSETFRSEGQSILIPHAKSANKVTALLAQISAYTAKSAATWTSKRKHAKSAQRVQYPTQGARQFTNALTLQYARKSTGTITTHHAKPASKRRYTSGTRQWSATQRPSSSQTTKKSTVYPVVQGKFTSQINASSAPQAPTQQRATSDSLAQCAQPANTLPKFRTSMNGPSFPPSSLPYA